MGLRRRRSAGRRCRPPGRNCGSATTRPAGRPPGTARRGAAGPRVGPAGRLAAQVLTAGQAARPAGARRQARTGLTEPAPGCGRVLQRRGYRYRADGCLTGIEDLLSGPRRLSLDPAGGSPAWPGPDWAEQYAYDPAGNITAATWPAPPGPAGAWVGAERAGPPPVRRDADHPRRRHPLPARRQGRIILRQRVRDSRKPDTWRYEWDADDQLTAVTTPDGTSWRYQYDPLGRRIAKQRLDADGQVAEQHRLHLGRPRPRRAGHHRAGGAARRPGHHLGLPARHLHPDDPGHRARPRLLAHAPQDHVDSQFYAIVTDLIGAPPSSSPPTATWRATSSAPCGAPPCGTPTAPPPRCASPASTPTPKPACTTTTTATTTPPPAATSPPTPSAWPPPPTPTPTSPTPSPGLDPLGLETPCEENPAGPSSGTPDFNDPSNPPGPGWVWRGPADKGSWYNPATGETLHPDLEHPDPIGPHYDYRAPDRQFYRIFPDGRIEPK